LAHFLIHFSIFSALSQLLAHDVVNFSDIASILLHEEWDQHETGTAQYIDEQAVFQVERLRQEE